MGGHGHGHGPPYKVPDASIYKVANSPELAEVERALARRSLKDWSLRNEVWRYNLTHFSSHCSRLVNFLFKGFPLGFSAFVATIGVEFALGIDYHYRSQRYERVQITKHRHARRHAAGSGDGR